MKSRRAQPPRSSASSLLLLGRQAGGHLLGHGLGGEEELHVLRVSLALQHALGRALRDLEGVHLLELVLLVVENVRHDATNTIDVPLKVTQRTTKYCKREQSVSCANG